jgi:glycosyltransferase involved in cell wall biosynthesis
MTIELTPPRAGWLSAPPGALRIAMLAPPWISVPPPGYGGIESVVSMLCDQLVADGHEVTLLAAPGSASAAEVHALLEDAHPDEIGSAMHECDHVARAAEFVRAEAAAGRPFDLVHDHSGFTAVAMATQFPVPVVHTLHGPFTEETSCFYARHGHKVSLVAISPSQARSAPYGVEIHAVCPNPIDVSLWPLREQKDGYLLWIGRMDAIKGPHHAIAAAALAGRPLVLAGPVQPNQQEFFAAEVEPHVDGERVRYAGEVGGQEKEELFAGADALLMPIEWEEPFGMVMVEALACGTPVIAFPRGAAADIVRDGRNGFLVEDAAEMAAAVARLPEIDPARCRADVEARFDTSISAGAYVSAYLALLEVSA